MKSFAPPTSVMYDVGSFTDCMTHPSLACQTPDYAIGAKRTSGDFDRYSWALPEYWHSQSDCAAVIMTFASHYLSHVRGDWEETLGVSTKLECDGKCSPK